MATENATLKQRSTRTSVQLRADSHTRAKHAALLVGTDLTAWLSDLADVASRQAFANCGLDSEGKVPPQAPLLPGLKSSGSSRSRRNTTTTS